MGADLLPSRSLSPAGRPVAPGAAARRPVTFQRPAGSGSSTRDGGPIPLRECLPGAYDMIPGAVPPLYHLDSIRPGNAPVEARWNYPRGETTIIYKTNGGTERGTVQAGSTWCPQTSGAGVSSPRPAMGSRFRINAVRPGEYHAQAVPAGRWSARAADPAYPQSAPRVTVGAGETSEVELPLSSVR